MLKFWLIDRFWQVQDCIKKGRVAATFISLWSSTIEFITTTKGKPALIFDGSRFTLNRRMDNGVCYLRCTKRTCPARITTEGNDLKQQTAGDSERHEKEPGKKSQQCQHLQRPSDSPEHRDSIALQLLTFTSMKSSLYRSHLVVNVS